MGWITDFVRNPIGTIGDTGQKITNEVSNAGKAIDRTIRDKLPGGWTTAALVAAGAYYSPEIGAWIDGTGATVATPAEVAAGDVAAGATSSSGTGLINGGIPGAFESAINAPAATSTGTGLTATQGTGTTLFAPATGNSGLGLTAGNATSANLAAMGGAQGLTTAGAAGGALSAAGLNSGAAATAGGLGSALGTGSAAIGAGTAATGAAGLTPEQQAWMGLIQGGLGLAGGLLSGSTASDALRQQSAQQAALAREAASMGKFNPIGTTTTFGTSKFTVDPTTGQLTGAGYTLSPELQAYQDQIMGSNRQSLTDATNLQNLGRGYIAQSPQEAAQQWMANQQALLAPSRDMESARLANQLQQTGRTGVSVAQGGGLGMANPEQQALANSRMMADLALAAQAQQQGQAQTTFGQGLLTGAYQPFNAGLTTSKNVEALAQQPFGMSTDLANLASTAGARQGNTYATLMAPSIANTAAANSYNPWATALQGAASNQLLQYGLQKAFG